VLLLFITGHGLVAVSEWLRREWLTAPKPFAIVTCVESLDTCIDYNLGVFGQEENPHGWEVRVGTCSSWHTTFHNVSVLTTCSCSSKHSPSKHHTTCSQNTVQVMTRSTVRVTHLTPGSECSNPNGRCTETRCTPSTVGRYKLNPVDP
jgi:hypothetical protein